jgi:hypothetical protein
MRCMQAGLEDARGFILFPLAVHTLDLAVSAAGIMSVGAKAAAREPNEAAEDPYDVMKVRGLLLASPGVEAQACVHVRVCE